MKPNAEYPRVLVFSNTCFSKSDSNGRTLGNLFSGWPKGRLAQFYIKSATPDFDVCDRYFLVTDGQALKAAFGKCKSGIVKSGDAAATNAPATALSVKIVINFRIKDD